MHRIDILEMSKAEYIDYHMESCNAVRVKKYDPKKPVDSLHSLEYSKRKCAKRIYNTAMRRKNKQTDDTKRS